MSFEREHCRYLVLKSSDIKGALTVEETEQLMCIAGKVHAHRKLANKPPRSFVVVEDDWPEYETVWRMIESRVNGKQPDKQPYKLKCMWGFGSPTFLEVVYDGYIDDESLEALRADMDNPALATALQSSIDANAHGSYSGEISTAQFGFALLGLKHRVFNWDRVDFVHVFTGRIRIQIKDMVP